jgi:hypothetical protein
MCAATRDVRFGPEADIIQPIRLRRRRRRPRVCISSIAEKRFKNASRFSGGNGFAAATTTASCRSVNPSSMPGNNPDSGRSQPNALIDRRRSETRPCDSRSRSPFATSSFQQGSALRRRPSTDRRAFRRHRATLHRHAIPDVWLGQCLGGKTSGTKATCSARLPAVPRINSAGGEPAATAETPYPVLQRRRRW